MPVAAFSHPPNCCPMCGAGKAWNPPMLREWMAGRSFRCYCGFLYQRAGEDQILASIECTYAWNTTDARDGLLGSK